MPLVSLPCTASQVFRSSRRSRSWASSRKPTSWRGRPGAASLAVSSECAYVRPDTEIEREIREDVAETALWIDASRLQISVDGGAVQLAGEVDRRADAELLERFTSAVPGVVSVSSELRWRFDEPKLPAGDPRVPRPPRP